MPDDSSLSRRDEILRALNSQLDTLFASDYDVLYVRFEIHANSYEQGAFNIELGLNWNPPIAREN